MTRTNSAEPALTVAGVIDEMLGLGRQKFKSWLPHPFNIATARNSGMRPRARLQRNACTSSAIMLEGAEQHNEIVERRWKARNKMTTSAMSHHVVIPSGQFSPRCHPERAGFIGDEGQSLGPALVAQPPSAVRPPHVVILSEAEPSRRIYAFALIRVAQPPSAVRESPCLSSRGARCATRDKALL